MKPSLKRAIQWEWVQNIEYFITLLEIKIKMYIYKLGAIAKSWAS